MSPRRDYSRPMSESEIVTDTSVGVDAAVSWLIEKRIMLTNITLEQNLRQFFSVLGGDYRSFAALSSSKHVTEVRHSLPETHNFITF
jgi:hypothetical protein